MKKLKFLLAAIVFFIVSAVFIAFHQSFKFLLPAQQVELSHGVEYGAVVKDFLFVQEITMQKRYVSRIDLYMAKLPSSYANENVFLLLNEQHQILFTKRFSSADFGEALYFPFDFGKNLDIGRGKKVYACIYSIDGDQGSYIGLAKKDNSNLGNLYVVTIVNNDIVQSFEKQQSLVNFKGSIGARTFESDTRFFSMLQVMLYFISLAIAALLFFGRQITVFIRRSRIVPEYAFLGFSLGFGFAMLVITPPFMVPDEAAHFYRSYEISEFNLFKVKNDVPTSLIEFASKCDRMRFSTHEKTTAAEILSLADIHLNPGDRAATESPDYTVSYLPQAFGIFLGRILHMEPLWLLYLGRIFNLLASAALVFLAIRTTPVLKWLFFLLGIMPMTLYQFSSLSYDALTISLSFLLTATILNYALNGEKRIGSRELIVLFILAGLLATAKPPYFLISCCFLIIPVAKIGSRKKYLITFISLVSAALIISQLSDPGRRALGRLFASGDPVPAARIFYATEESMPAEVPYKHNPLAASLPLLPHASAGVQASEKQPDTAGNTPQQGQEPGQGSQPDKGPLPAGNPIDPSAQKQFILDNPAGYIGIMFNTILNSMGLYAVGLIGLFGWVDTPLPASLAYVYLFFLLLATLGFPAGGMQLGFVKKCLLFAVFLACLVLIETAMYFYCNPVGSNSIIAVQGRYFIALAPLLFLLFHNGAVHKFLERNILFPSKKTSPKKLHRKEPAAPGMTEEMLLSKAIPWLAMLMAFCTLVYSVFVILERFYVVVM